ncbi:unnamed protein product, partial [Urochloa humidicola]
MLTAYLLLTGVSGLILRAAAGASASGDPPLRRAALEPEVVGVKQSSSKAILLCAPSTAKVWWLGVGCRKF